MRTEPLKSDKTNRYGITAAVLMTAAGLAAAWGAGRMMPGQVTGEIIQEIQEIPGPDLTQEEMKLVNRLYAMLEADNLATAAVWINSHKEEFSSIYYEGLEGEDWLYDGEQWSETLEGRGLVFKKGSSLFFGEFAGGKPEGENLAFQALEIDDPRYDYAKGQWKDGQMDGQGTCGYNYYHGTDTGPVMTEKEGIYRGDLLEGAFRYTMVLDDVGEASWNMKAEAGVLVIDDSWTYDEETGVYRLISYDNDRAGYVLAQEEMSAARWRNLLQWY